MRVIERIEQIPGFCDVIKKRFICQDEVFLLLLATLLHDIGMQCDLNKFPKVKKRVEDEGISFSDVPTDRELREYHHIITSAWLHIAYFDSEVSPLKNIINSGNLTESQVRHIEKICSYHSKKDITKCDEISLYGDKVQLRFLSAILRLGDELDIDEKRVNIETMDEFVYPENSALYWYIHSKTKVEISKTEILIKLTVSFNDFAKHGCEFVEYIRQIYEKNESVLKVLRLNGLPIEFGRPEDCVKSDDLSDIPDKIVSKLFPYSEAIKPLITSALDGNADSQHTLGVYYSKGCLGIIQDHDQAVRYYTMAAKQGHIEAQCDLGECYYEGRGIDRDYNQAVYWWEKAAEKDCIRAQHGLSSCYFHGHGVGQDLEKATMLFTNATKQSSVVAQNNLGEC